MSQALKLKHSEEHSSDGHLSVNVAISGQLNQCHCLEHYLKHRVEKLKPVYLSLNFEKVIGTVDSLTENLAKMVIQMFPHSQLEVTGHASLNALLNERIPAMTGNPKLLIAVGAEPSSLSAARYAVALAPNIGMKPILFHVDEFPVSEIIKMKAARTGEIDIKKADAVRKLLELQKELGIDVDTIVRLGDIGNEAAHVASLNLNVQWVVVGRRNKGAVAEFILGRVSEQITRAVELPVLIVPPDAEHRGGGLNVMVTTDLSEGAKSAFAHAARLAKGGSLTVYHVYEDDDWDSSTLEATTAELKAHQEFDFQFGLKAEKGKPKMLIPQAIEDLNIDVLVCATHNRQGFDKLMSGSVTDGLIQKVSIPTLIVRRSGTS